MPCDTIVVNEAALQTILMPGGGRLSVQLPQPTPTDLAVAKTLISQANSALSPLQPIFDIIGTINAIGDFAKAVPDVISNPASVIEAIEELNEKIGNLAALVPQVSVPKMALDMIDTIILALRGLDAELLALEEQQTKITAAASVAVETDNTTLLEVTECAQQLNDTTFEGVVQSLGPINVFIELLNTFTGLIGLEGIPSLEGGSDLSATRSLLTASINVLEALRGTIPI